MVPKEFISRQRNKILHWKKKKRIKFNINISFKERVKEMLYAIQNWIEFFHLKFIYSKKAPKIWQNLQTFFFKLISSNKKCLEISF